MQSQVKKLATTSIVALALGVTPAVISPTIGLDVDSASAKPGKGNGNGNGKSASSGKSTSAGKGHGKSASKGHGNSKKNRTLHHQRKAYIDDDEHESRPLHPSEKGRWNASNANQRALDAHIRNQNFNGTIGALSQYQLAAKAAAGDELNEYERDALENFIDTSEPEIGDDEIADFLNENSATNGLVFEVDNGDVSCVEGCPEDESELAALNERAQMAADGFVEDSQEEITQERLDEFLTESEQRIVDDSNKTLSEERNEDLLDELAEDLGVVRQEFSEGLKEAGEQISEDLNEAGDSIRKASKEIGNAFRGFLRGGN